MRQNLAQLIEAGLGLVKILKNARVLDRLVAIVDHKVLFGDIGLVAARVVLREQVVKRLVLGGPDFLRDRLVPFLSVGVLGVDVVDDPAKAEEAVGDDLSDIELGAVFTHALT